ncbi:Uma2 family endonuclease [Streptomyces sp. NPDC020362]|uniref:Uma2 family endonuclease n=1 Tax=unclassified Streptomyces TaxID=2593676 RepID=UPI000A8479F4
MPDLCVVPEKAQLGKDEYFAPADVAELVVEITSAATAQNDRTTKAAGYAEAAVPLYLLVDGLAPTGPTVTLYGDAEGGAYRVLESVEFGASVGLPGPFHLTLPVG